MNPPNARRPAAAGNEPTVIRIQTFTVNDGQAAAARNNAQVVSKAKIRVDGEIYGDTSSGTITFTQYKQAGGTAAQGPYNLNIAGTSWYYELAQLPDAPGDYVAIQAVAQTSSDTMRIQLQALERKPARG
jgi:hypothetical protein